MAKRRLTHRQQWRIKKIHQERLKRAQRNEALAQASQENAQLGPEQEGLVIARFGAQADVLSLENNSEGKVHRCHLRTNLESIVTGELVIWRATRDKGGVIVASLPRRSTIARPDAGGKLRPIAANIDQVFLVIAPTPLTPSGLIDRYLVALETLELNITILVNKSDLTPAKTHDELALLTDLYTALGYKTVHTSTKNSGGIHELKALLCEHTSIFVGQSGVGKSSLINAILPDTNTRVGEVSAATGKGIHTTTTTTLFQIASGGYLIDSPGIREFGLWHISLSDLAQGFVEFRPYLGQCRFRDCSHLNEPDCAIQAAHARGEINSWRMSNFQQIAATL